MYEYEYRGEVLQAVHVYRKDHRFSESVNVFYFKSIEAAMRFAKEINDARVHMYSEYADVEIVDGVPGAFLVVTEPNND